MGRVSHLVNKMYREMMCITRHEGWTYITFGPSGVDDFQAGASSWPPQYRTVLSWDLLAWISVEGRIPCSFTTFITTPELSGPLYISPAIYHTQITEYLQWALFSLHWTSSSLLFYRKTDRPTLVPFRDDLNTPTIPLASESSGIRIYEPSDPTSQTRLVNYIIPACASAILLSLLPLFMWATALHIRVLQFFLAK